MSKEVERVEERLPWEKQPNESVPAFRAFAHYRDLGPKRTLKKTAQDLGKNATTIGEWSSKHGWVARIDAYEHYLDRRLLEQRETEQARKNREQSEQGEWVRSMAMARLVGAEGITGIDWSLIEPKEALEALRLGTKMERDAEGITITAGMTPNAQVKRLLHDVTELALEFMTETARTGFMQRLKVYIETGT